MLCLFDLILYVPSTIFQLNRDGSSWVEPVLSKDKCVLLKDHNAVTPVRLKPAASRSRVKHSTTEPLRSLRGGGNTCCKKGVWFLKMVKKYHSHRLQTNTRQHEKETQRTTGHITIKVKRPATLI